MFIISCKLCQFNLFKTLKAYRNTQETLFLFKIHLCYYQQVDPEAD